MVLIWNRHRNQNLSKVGTGAVINSYGSATLPKGPGGRHNWQKKQKKTCPLSSLSSPWARHRHLVLGFVIVIWSLGSSSSSGLWARHRHQVLGLVIVIWSLGSSSSSGPWARHRYLVLGLVIVIRSLGSSSSSGPWARHRHLVLGLVIVIWSLGSSSSSGPLATSSATLLSAFLWTNIPSLENSIAECSCLFSVKMASPLTGLLKILR